MCLDLCLDEESSVLLSMRMLPLLREAGLCPDRSLCRAEGLPGGPGGPEGAFRSKQLAGKKRAPGPTPAVVLEFGSSGCSRPSLRFPTDLASLSALWLLDRLRYEAELLEEEDMDPWAESAILWACRPCCFSDPDCSVLVLPSRKVWRPACCCCCCCWEREELGLLWLYFAPCPWSGSFGEGPKLKSNSVLPLASLGLRRCGRLLLARSLLDEAERLRVWDMYWPLAWSVGLKVDGGGLLPLRKLLLPR